MLYPVTVGSLYIQTDSILKMTVSGSTYTVIMNDAAVTSQTVTAAQFADIINIVNGNHG